MMVGTASKVTVTDTTSGTGPYYIPFTQGTTGNQSLLVDSDGVTYNATTNTLTVTASFANTASYIEPIFISASAAASGFGSGGVTSINAGNGISVNQTTGNVIITNTGGSGGISQGKVVAIATGMANLF
jgi:DNA-binding beta-propeller fold protein YncE